MKYKILRSGEMEELQKKVNKYIGKGWAPIGGISVCGGYGHAHFHQAIQKGCDTQDYPTIADINAEDYKYAKEIFEMRNESNKLAIWECEREEFDEVWASLPGNTPWIKHFNRWVGSPSSTESERDAKSVGKKKHAKFLNQPTMEEE